MSAPGWPLDLQAARELAAAEVSSGRDVAIFRDKAEAGYVVAAANPDFQQYAVVEVWDVQRLRRWVSGQTQFA